MLGYRPALAQAVDMEMFGRFVMHVSVAVHATARTRMLPKGARLDGARHVPSKQPDE